MHPKISVFGLHVAIAKNAIEHAIVTKGCSIVQSSIIILGLCDLNSKGLAMTIIYYGIIAGILVADYFTYVLPILLYGSEGNNQVVIIYNLHLFMVILSTFGLCLDKPVL